MKSPSEMKPARQLVGIVDAAAESIESWFAVGDPRVALDLATGARRAAAESPGVGRQASDLSQVVPEPILQVISDRVARHWRAYEEALGERLTREQTQAIHFALLACMSKELESLRDLQPILPPGVIPRWWVEYT